MHTPDEQARRFSDLIELACTARGWTRAELAKHLGRDPSRLVPEGGNPKMDYLQRMAEAIEWTIDDVVAYVMGGADPSQGAPEAAAESTDYATLHRRASEVFHRGEHRKAIRISYAMQRIARSDDERAIALSNEAASWAGLGRYLNAVEAGERGLALKGTGVLHRLHLQMNIAHALLHLWRLDLAVGMCDRVIHLSGLQPQCHIRDRILALTALTRGLAHARLARIEAGRAGDHLKQARADLSDSKMRHADLARCTDEPELGGLAHWAEAALIELGVLDGSIEPGEAFPQVDRAIDKAEANCGNYWRESIGWWALTGAMISLRSLRGRELQRRMALYVGRALDVGEELQNWALKERALTMQYLGHETVERQADVEIEYVLDREDRSLVAAVMSRFPHFREVGWRLLNTDRSAN